MAKQKTGDYIQQVPMPLKGVADHGAFSSQEKGTSANMTNVVGFDPRTGRQRLAQRSGLTKYINQTVNGNSSIQDMASISVPANINAGGLSLALGSSSGVVSLYNLSGTKLYDSPAIGTTVTFLGLDSSGDCYAASANTGNNTLTAIKINANASLSWQTSVANLGSQHLSGGVVVASGVVYILAQASGAAKLYRLYSGNGTLIDGGAWKTEANGLPTAFSSGGYLQTLGYTNGILGILGNVGTFVQINIGTGNVTANTSLGSATIGGSVSADPYGNFYASCGGSSAFGKLAKVNSSGVILWSNSTIRMPNGVAYDPVNDYLAVAGSGGDTLGTASSVLVLYASNGALKASGNPASQSNYTYVAADGLGSFRIGNPGVMRKVDSNLTISWNATVGGFASASGVVASSAFTSPSVDLMAKSRTIRTLVASGGTVKRFSSNNLTAITNGAGAFYNSSVILSAPNGLYVYYVDGVQYKRYNSFSDSMEQWTATSGALPSSITFQNARLVETWRGRTVLSGVPSDPQNWFMSAVDNPLDFNYLRSPEDAVMAVAGNNSEAGLVGDQVNCMIPFSDDILIFGCDHSIWRMAGDPMAGGQIDRISDITGMAFGRPWCKDPSGIIYFFGSRGGVFRMAPGGQPERISQRIEERLANVNLASNIVRMAWEDRQQGVFLTITPTDASLSSTHYWYDARNQGWFPLTFANVNHNPKVLFTLDGDDPNDRAMLFGSNDGYIRKWDRTAASDDGTAISSFALIGPFHGDLDEITFGKEMRATLASDSANLTWSIQQGSTDQEAFSATARAPNGTWRAGSNYWDQPMIAAGAWYIKIQGTDQWAIESLIVRIEQLAGTRRKIGF